ncbi:shikimate kinase [Verrucomicrobiales bacterium]|nr:shikimate kinase [Verrucomicrobiales bacterium]
MMPPVDTTGTRARNLILIGFMGTGKTSVGMRVAKSLGFTFVDTDQLIVEKAGKPIPKIFEEDGEPVFRKIETDVLRESLTQENQVISTGGGIVTNEENRKMLKEAGYTIWLQAGPDTIYDRVSRNKNRPLLQTEDPKATILQMLADRNQSYCDSMDLAIKTDELTLEETCYGVTESARIALCI